jgi:hypothetical protein
MPSGSAEDVAINCPRRPKIPYQQGILIDAVCERVSGCLWIRAPKANFFLEALRSPRIENTHEERQEGKKEIWIPRLQRVVILVQRREDIPSTP